jgi:hypothetical protein
MKTLSDTNTTISRGLKGAHLKTSHPTVVTTRNSQTNLSGVTSMNPRFQMCTQNPEESVRGASSNNKPPNLLFLSIAPRTTKFFVKDVVARKNQRAESQRPPLLHCPMSRACLQCHKILIPRSKKNHHTPPLSSIHASKLSTMAAQ